MLVYDRRAWGAEHPDGFGSAPLPAREVWLHHSVTGAPTVNASFETDVAAVRLLEQIGQARFGGGISYTFAVAPSGRIFQGHSVGRRGAHTAGRNSIARAIVLIGDYSRDRPGPAMVDAVAGLLIHGHRLGWWTAPRLTGGHRQAPGARTACPGDGGVAAVADINLAAASGPTGPPGPLPPPDTRPAPVLRRGSVGEWVRSLQAWLNAHDWTPDLPLLVVDGRFGPATESVVRAAQAQLQLVPDGIVGARTTAAFQARGWRP